MKRYLVMGASGTVGSSIVQSLKEQGEKVRAATSKRVVPEELEGVQWVHLNAATGEGIKEAFEGIQGAFLMSPPGYADQHRVLSPLIHQAKVSGLEKVVLMTAMGANANEAAPFRRAELELERSGLAFNIVRPNWFMQNFNSYWIQGIIGNGENGKIQLPAGAAQVSFIDTKDISDVAVRLLTRHDLDNRAYDLTGPTSLSHSEVAEIISKTIGRRVTYKNVEPGVLKQGLLAAGLPEDYSDFMLMIMGFLREGHNARITDGVKEVLGRDPIRFEQYVRNYKQSWKLSQYA